MLHNGEFFGLPPVNFRNTKATIEAIGLADLEPGMSAYATDLQQLGHYNGTRWDWIPYTVHIGPDPPTAPSTPYDGQVWIDTDESGHITMKYVFTIVTGPYTVLLTDQIVLCNGTFTVTLPAAATCAGQGFRIKNIGLGIVTLVGDGGEMIEKETEQELWESDCIGIMSDGSQWWIVL